MSDVPLYGREGIDRIVAIREHVVPMLRIAGPRAKRLQLQRCRRLLTGSHRQNLAVTVIYEPNLGLDCLMRTELKVQGLGIRAELSLGLDCLICAEFRV